LALLKAQLLALDLALILPVSLARKHQATSTADTISTAWPEAVHIPQSVTCSSPRRWSDRATRTVSRSGLMV
jgi:hypothetical protein